MGQKWGVGLWAALMAHHSLAHRLSSQVHGSLIPSAFTTRASLGPSTADKTRSPSGIIKSSQLPDRTGPLLDTQRYAVHAQKRLRMLQLRWHPGGWSDWSWAKAGSRVVVMGLSKAASCWPDLVISFNRVQTAIQQEIGPIWQCMPVHISLSSNSEWHDLMTQRGEADRNRRSGYELHAL